MDDQLPPQRVGTRRDDALSRIAYEVLVTPTPTGQMLVLPPFDEYGNIPAGRHEFLGGSSIVVGLAELRERFVQMQPESETRARIWAGWMEHRRRLLDRGITFDTWINGSFCTSKLNPADADLCVLYEAAAVDALHPDGQQELLLLFDPTYCKQHFRCDPHPIAAYDFHHERYRQTMRQIVHWTRVFGSDRNDRPKAILVVRERGVL